MSEYVPNLIWWLYLWHCVFGHPPNIVRYGPYRFCVRCGFTVGGKV